MTACGRLALEELRDAVREAENGDPMASVTVLVPDNIAGVVARRCLAHGFGGGHAGAAAVYPTTVLRLAEPLAAPSLHDHRPATGPVVAAGWRAALHDEAGAFDPMPDHPATAHALVRAKQELRDPDDHTPDAVDTVDHSLPPSSGRTARS